MRRLRNFQTDMCYHLISRVAHRAFFLNEEERTRFLARPVTLIGTNFNPKKRNIDIPVLEPA